MKRTLSKNKRLFIMIPAFCGGIYHLFKAATGAPEPFYFGVVHLTWVLPLVFLIYPACEADTERLPIYDIVAAVFSTFPGMYVITHYEEILDIVPGIGDITAIQCVLGILTVLLLLEATRRTVGMPLAFLEGIVLVSTLISILYSDFSTIVTQFSSYVALQTFVEELFLSDNGIYSIPLYTVASVLTVFMILGGVMVKGGASDFSLSAAEALTGTKVGGPAKIAVMSSKRFGAVSSSPVANVYTTGAFTIPMMKHYGYKPAFAGAVEAVASTGGELMPPVLGAGAFLMASFLHVPFRRILLISILPSFLYYSSVMMMVDLTSKRDGTVALNPEDVPSLKEILKSSYMTLPSAFLIILLVAGYTPALSALFAIATGWAVSFTRSGKFLTPRRMARTIAYSFAEVCPLSIACAASGMIIGALTFSGTGTRLIGVCLSIGHGKPFIMLIIVALLCLSAGMYMPTVGAYVLVSGLSVPALSHLGFSPLSAHMFVFYFAVLSNITPPVAPAAFAGASLAGSDPYHTAWDACRLGIVAFIVPFAFCYNPGLLFELDKMHNILAAGCAFALVTGMSVCLTGFCNGKLHLFPRLMFALFGLLSMWPNPVISCMSAAVTMIMFLSTKFRRSGHNGGYRNKGYKIGNYSNS